MRVLDLAKELGLETKVAILKLQEIGVQVKNHFNAVTDADADKLRSLVKGGKKPASADAKGKATAGKVVIRRRAAESTDSSHEDTPQAAAPAPQPEPEAKISAPEKQAPAAAAAKPVE